MNHIPHPFWHFAIVIFMAFAYGQICGGIHRLILPFGTAPAGKRYWIITGVMIGIVIVGGYQIGGWMHQFLLNRGI